jgi:CheY-like chemotaxis protein
VGGPNATTRAAEGPCRSQTGRDALRYLKQHPNEVRLLITDLVMPVMDGGELAERACEIQPKLQIALMSTDPNGHDAELLAGYPEFRVLQKPVTFERLYGLLAALVGPPGGLRRQRPRQCRATASGLRIPAIEAPASTCPGAAFGRANRPGGSRRAFR